MDSRNHRYYARLSGYQVKYITDSNYRSFLPKTIFAKIDRLLNIFSRDVKERIKTTGRGQMTRDGLVVSRRIKALHVLWANGGIMLDQRLKLTESLDWVNEVDSNPYVNRLNRTYPTEVVGFYNFRSSSEK